MAVPRLESKESVPGPGPFQTFKCFTIEIGSDVSALTPKECENVKNCTLILRALNN
jgi:hypothetical protein